MPNDFYVTFMSKVSDPLYNDLNKTSDFWTKLFPAIKFDDGKYEVALVDCIPKTTYDNLRKGRVYDIKVIPFDWSLFVDYEWVEALKSSEYPHVKLKYIEYDNMTNSCRTINRKISYRRKSTFHFNYSMEYDRIYITSPVDSEIIILNGNLEVLGFKQNMINGKNADTVYGMDQVIFADYKPGFA